MISLHTRGAMAAIALVAAIVTPAFARDWERASGQFQVKGCKITVYVDPEFTGPSWSTTNGWAKVGWEFNDAISSVKVHSGIWVFYKEDDFQGEVGTLFPGDYGHLSHNADNVISSFRCQRPT